ncbi:hypothetical protein GCM10023190_13300 [Enteractinococcus fodinae]
MQGNDFARSVLLDRKIVRTHVHRDRTSKGWGRSKTLSIQIVYDIDEFGKIKYENPIAGDATCMRESLLLE